MKPTPFFTGAALLGCMAFLSAPLLAESVAGVAIRATAAADYAQQHLTKDGPAQEGYVFTQGQFSPGAVRDPSLKRTTFMDIAQVLARTLVKQNYYPVKDQRQARLLLVVHWGVTSVEENPIGGFQQDDLNSSTADYHQQVQSKGMANADPSGVTFNVEIQQGEASAQQNSIIYNAQLLGFDQRLMKEHRRAGASLNGITDEERGLRAELNEERYFIVVMAYDDQVLQKEHKKKLLWTTRISMRASGNNFSQAFPALCRAASNYFGRQLPDLVTETADFAANGTEAARQAGATK